MININQLTLGQLKEILSTANNFDKDCHYNVPTPISESRYVIVRSYGMGVFAGYLHSDSTETLKILTDARRIWAWKGAASLSQLSIDGTSKPSECKFPESVSRVELTSPTHGFEILDVTEKAKKSNKHRYLGDL